MYEVYVCADTNDADYVSDVFDATQEDILKLEQVAGILAENHGHFETQDIGDWREEYPEEHHEILDWFGEMFVPRSEYGVHTIEDIKYYLKPEKIVLL